MLNIIFISEVNAAAGLFPITVTCRIRSLAATNLTRLFALGLRLARVFFGILWRHGESMPDTSKKMSEIPYSTITVSGRDAFAFLQAQLTADLNEFSRQADMKSLRSAWCNPKGRVICMPTVAAEEQDFALLLPADLAEPVMQRLTMFRFRSRVEFQLQAQNRPAPMNALEMLHAGVPEIALAQSEKFTAHMLNLDLLNIVSLKKGCYPGQEIVARTHYRGASKRRLLRFASSAPVNAGDKVCAGEREIGEVVNAIGNDLLAVVPLDAADGSLTIGGARLTQIDLPYSLQR